MAAAASWAVIGRFGAVLNSQDLSRARPAVHPGHGQPCAGARTTGPAVGTRGFLAAHGRSAAPVMTDRGGRPGEGALRPSRPPLLANAAARGATRARVPMLAKYWSTAVAMPMAITCCPRGWR